MKQMLVTGAPAALMLCLCALCVAQQQPTTRELRERIDDRETREDLLGQTRQRVLERMDQSTFRLKREFDPGRTTQIIQERILEDLDKVINELARRKREEKPPKGPGPDEPGVPGDPDPRNSPSRPGPVDDNINQTPADKSGLTRADRDLKPSSELRQRGEVFLEVVPRNVRKDVIEGATEYIIPKYRKLTEDYYRGVATAARR